MKKNISIFCICFLGAQYFACVPGSDDDLKGESFKGLIIKKSENKVGCHGDFLIVDNHKTQSIKTVCHCVPEIQNIWDYAAVGDTLLKPKDELFLYVIRKNETRKYEYPICIR